MNRARPRYVLQETMWPRIVAEARWLVWVGAACVLASMACLTTIYVGLGTLYILTASVRESVPAPRAFQATFGFALLGAALWLSLFGLAEKQWCLRDMLVTITCSALGLALLVPALRLAWQYL